MSGYQSITAVILAGGFGTRLKSRVADRPKVMAEVCGRPFLTILLDFVVSSGIKRVVLCTGFMSGYIEEALGGFYKGAALIYSAEPQPLGTGGALRYALDVVKSETILVLNGDSFCDLSLRDFHCWHLSKGSGASLALAQVPDCSRYGQVLVDSNDRVTDFLEKRAGSGAGSINSGVYLLSRSLFEDCPEGQQVSLEREIFPKLIGGPFYGYPVRGDFIDIGLPDSYDASIDFFRLRLS
jgi:D-glycero-alpha-D-manno-heptose 1-phosphate guanylyltransferase